MDKKVRLTIGILFLLIITSVLGGCKSTQYIPAKEVKVDTVYKARKDSIRWINHTNIRDSTRIKDSIVIHINGKGEVTGTDTWHWREKYRTEKDSTAYYKSKCDSLIHAKVDSISKSYPVAKEKVVYKMHTLQKCFMWIGIANVLIGLIYVLYKLNIKFDIVSLIKRILHI